MDSVDFQYNQILGASFVTIFDGDNGAENFNLNDVSDLDRFYDFVDKLTKGNV